MNRLIVESGTGLTGIVYPDYGGMLGKLRYRGRDILHLDEARLPEGAVLSGGNPVLFPCASKTEGDRYTLNGRTYRMPFHGLVRDSAFGVESVEKDCVTLVRTGCSEWARDLYPFDFELRLVYRVLGNRLTLGALVKNNTDSPMPHAFGWHPYFCASDKARFFVRPNMGRCALYQEGGPREIDMDAVDLTSRADYVYWARQGAALDIENAADRYAVRMVSDRAFGALVLCTKFDGTICVEPWMGLPNAMNTGVGLQYVQPGTQARYDVHLDIREM